MVVLSLVVYLNILSDGRMSRRDQTMVRPYSFTVTSASLPLTLTRITPRPQQLDLYLFRVPRPRVRYPEQRSRMLAYTEQNAPNDSLHILLCPTWAHLPPFHATCIPDRSARILGPVHTAGARCYCLRDA